MFGGANNWRLRAYWRQQDAWLTAGYTSAWSHWVATLLPGTASVDRQLLQPSDVAARA